MIMLATALVVALEAPIMDEVVPEPEVKVPLEELIGLSARLEQMDKDLNGFETTKWCFYMERGCGRITAVPRVPPEHPRPDRPCQADKPHCKPDGPVASVPEPSTLLLLLAGLVALFALRKIQKD